MPIQILLTAGLSAALLYASVQEVMPRTVRAVFALLVASGIYFVWLPDHTTILARWLGVARGTDLLIYLWILLTLIVGLNLHLKIQSAREEITELARALALAAPRDPGSETLPGVPPKPEEETAQ
jgi:hypothetical protein